MTDCSDLIDELARQAEAQIALAMIAQAPSVAAMHIDLAVLGNEQSRVAEALCDGAEP